MKVNIVFLLSLCFIATTTAAYSISDIAISVALSSRTADSSQKCSICQILEKDLVGDDEQTMEDVLSSVSQKCSGFYNPYWISTCRSIVEGTGKKLISYSLENKNEKEISACEYLHICPSSHNFHDFECSVCEWVTTEGENRVKDNEKEIDIIDAMIDSCTILIDESAIGKCKKFVEENGEVIIKHLSSNQKSSEICSHALHVCNSTTFSSSIHSESESGSKDVKIKPTVEVHRNRLRKNLTLECEICYKLVEEAIELNDGMEGSGEIQQAMRSSCSSYRDNLTYLAECYALAGKWAQEIVTDVMRGVDPSIICMSVDHCPF